MSRPQPESSPHCLEFHDVTVAYGRRPVLWNIDLTVDGPGLFGIIGPNGAGKSTLLKAALGLVPLAGGSVQFFGQPLRAVRTRVGYVPQRETVDWARDCLLRVGLADVANRQIGRLSGGQQQRVFLARALAQQADLYFLDEPMAGVDARSQEQIFAVLSALRAAGKLIVVVHHDLRSASEWFDRVALVDMRLIATGPAAEVLTPENLQRTYAGPLDVLDELGRAVARRERTP